MSSLSSNCSLTSGGKEVYVELFSQKWSVNLALTVRFECFAFSFSITSHSGKTHEDPHTPLHATQTNKLPVWNNHTLKFHLSQHYLQCTYQMLPLLQSFDTSAYLQIIVLCETHGLVDIALALKWIWVIYLNLYLWKLGLNFYIFPFKMKTIIHICETV